MAESFMQSLDSSIRDGLANSLDATKKATYSTGKKFRNYCSFTQERVQDQVRNIKDFRTRRSEGCLGSLFPSPRKSSRSWEDDEDYYSSREDSQLLPGPQSKRYRQLGKQANELQEEVPKKELIFKRAVKLIGSKLTSNLRQAGSWLVKGLQGYADAVNPQGAAFNHTNVLYMYPYNIA